MDAVICKQVQVREWEAMDKIHKFKRTATRPSVTVLEDLISLLALIFPKHIRVPPEHFERQHPMAGDFHCVLVAEGDGVARMVYAIG
jgi:hypothetical protein